MCEAMLQSLLSKQLIRPDSLMVSEPRDKRRRELQEVFRINVTNDNRQAVKSAKIIIFSVKPQDFAVLRSELNGVFQHDQLIMSIVAGATIASIARGMGHNAVVRVMPNTPAQIGEGISVWTSSQANQNQINQARMILQALGKELYMQDEKFLDMATAISGTGPTYVFLVMESLIDAAVHLGFPRHIAYELVTETMRGSILFAMKSGKHPAELRNMVTSPGGTSAEALYQLEKGGLRTVLSKAIWAAYERSRSLGDENEKWRPEDATSA